MANFNLMAITADLTLKLDAFKALLVDKYTKMSK